jgi:prophage antirepressor-like protein
MALCRFQHDGRTLQLLIREDGAIGAILNELAAFLGYNDAKQALNDHVTKPGWRCTLAQFEEGGKHPPSSDASRGRLAASGKRRNRYNEGRQTVVLEPGINAMLLGSRLPAAQACREWLCEEVMPAIARTGTYSAVKTPQQSLQDTLTLLADRVGSTRVAARIGNGGALLRGVDVMRAIGLRNPALSLGYYLEGWGLPRDDEAYLTPAQVYDVLTRSRKPKAQRFRRWTCAEVLPAHKP